MDVIFDLYHNLFNQSIQGKNIFDLIILVCTFGLGQFYQIYTSSQSELNLNEYNHTDKKSQPKLTKEEHLS